MGDCLDQPCSYLQDRTFEIIPENFVDGLCPLPIITRSCLEANPTDCFLEDIVVPVPVASCGPGATLSADSPNFKNKLDACTSLTYYVL